MIKLIYLKNHFKNKKILITGHNGFKGTWLCIFMTFLGAKVIGCGLKESNRYSFFKFISKNIYKSVYLDICDYNKFYNVIILEKPDYIVHLAAQALVFESYSKPYGTFKNNIISSLNLLEILRVYKNKTCALFITSDKVYKNIEKISGYKESALLGGEDPYSASKASIELIIDSYIQSFILKKGNIKISIARAGNVIGGGDWSKNRVIPDIIRSYFSKKKFILRSPYSERPWQHVLDPLYGYVLILLNLSKKKIKNGSIFNFGPSKKNTINVDRLVNILSNKLYEHNNFKLDKIVKSSNLKETNILRLNSEKAKKSLGWQCNLSIEKSLEYTSDWYTYYYKSKFKNKIYDFSIKQIENYFKLIR